MAKKKNSLWNNIRATGMQILNTMKNEKGLFFRKMLAIYVVSTTLVFALLGMLIGISVQNNYIEELEAIDDRALKQSVNTCSNDLRNLFNYYYTESQQSEEIASLLRAGEYTRELSIKASKASARLSNYSNLVKSCYLINLHGGFVCSTIDTFKSIEEFPDKDILEQLESIQGDTKRYIFIPRTVSLDRNGEQEKEKCISLIFRKNSQGYLVVNLDVEVFSSLINYNNYSDLTRTILLSSDNQVLADSANLLFGTDYSHSPVYDKIMSGGGEQDITHIWEQGGRQRIAFYRNEYLGITYLTIMEGRGLQNNLLLMRTFFYTVVAILLNLVFIFAGSCLLYRPIEVLQNMVGTGMEEKPDWKDEFRMIGEALQTMKRTTKEYQKSVRSRALRELLEDYSPVSEVQRRDIEKLKEQWGGLLWVVVNLYPDLESLPESVLSENLELTRFAMVNILKEHLPENIRMESVDYEEHLSCVFGIALPEGVSLKAEGEDAQDVIRVVERTGLKGALNGMQKLMLDYYRVDVTCGVGNMVQSIYDISESAVKAKTAVFYQMTKETGAVFYDGEFTSNPEEGSVYPDTRVKSVLEAVRNSDQGKIRETVADFFYTLSRRPYDSALKYLYLMELEMTRQEIRYHIHNEYKNMDLLKSSRSGNRLYMIQEKCLKYCLEVAGAYQETKENNPNMLQIVEKVKALVEGNLTNPELTVNWLAKEIYLSTSYLRAIFRETTGGPLSGYIIERKLEEICRLLRETDCSIEQIAEKTGFSNKNYLYTFFKNYKGMTPSQYRKM